MNYESLKKTVRTAAFLGCMAGSFVLGKFYATDNQYGIERPDDVPVALFYNKDSGQRLPIYPTERGTFVGSSEHHLQGVREVARLEGQESMRPTIDALQRHSSTLEKKIAARQFTDRVEEVWDDVCDGVRNIKHNLIK
jgi:hypothetical protein